MFKVIGARATSTHYGFDRYWRDLRLKHCCEAVLSLASLHCFRYDLFIPTLLR